MEPTKTALTFEVSPNNFEVNEGELIIALTGGHIGVNLRGATPDLTKPIKITVEVPLAQPR